MCKLFILHYSKIREKKTFNICQCLDRRSETSNMFLKILNFPGPVLAQTSNGNTVPYYLGLASTFQDI